MPDLHQRGALPSRLAAAAMALLLGLLPVATGPAVAPMVAAASAPIGDRLGIDHISYGNGTFSADRYRLAQSTGAGWNRWVFYWNEIERTQGLPDYTRQDRTVAADNAQNLKILGILLGTPDWASGAGGGTRPATLPPPQVGQRRYPDALTAETARVASASPITTPPQGLDRPVFADGTDTPGPGKAINLTNPWARFVHQTVTRYKGKVHAWEIWNEPDFTPTAGTGWFGFWTGTVDQYARLLKVAYLAAKSADPGATVVMGGMAFWHQPDFFPRLLRSIRLDPTARSNNFYFDATGWHWYSRASQLYERTLWVKDELSRAGITGKGVWVTEANLPVCGDPALKEQLTCTLGSHRGTLEHQAAFIAQALSYAFVAGVDKVFIFQLYDDDLGPGEYYGLVRNDGTARPALAALRVAAGYLSGSQAVYRTLNNGGRVEMITILNDKKERVRMVWGTGRDPATIDLPVEGIRPIRGDQYGSVQPLGTAPGAAYRMAVAPATLDDGPRGYPDYIVGGPVTVVSESSVTLSEGRVRGSVRDADGRPLAGVPVRVGDRVLTSASAGEFAVDVMPGLYDVAVAEESAFPARTAPLLSVAVWSGRAVEQAFSVQPQRRLTLPFVVRGSQQPVR